MQQLPLAHVVSMARALERMRQAVSGALNPTFQRSKDARQALGDMLAEVDATIATLGTPESIEALKAHTYRLADLADASEIMRFPALVRELQVALNQAISDRVA